MSIYNEYVPRKRKPFKTVMVEYFEEFENDTTRVSPMWQGPGVRRIQIVTTTSSYNMGSAKGDPVVSTIYEYL
jgi:hypothetical protein